VESERLPLSSAEISAGDYLICVLFGRSRSKSFGAALLAARHADRYMVETVDGYKLHAACFGRSSGQAFAASQLIAIAGKWKGVQIYAGGRLVESSGVWPERVKRTLLCFAKSGRASDRSAHCCVVKRRFQCYVPDRGKAVAPLASIKDGEITLHVLPAGQIPPSRQALVIPCRRTVEEIMYVFAEGNPASLDDQLQAAAVRAGCEWCPLFGRDSVRPARPPK
jgi:hypothetical protein